MKKKPGDYHLHTQLCRHALGTVDQYVRAAREQGLDEICFTDHIPLPLGKDPEHRMSFDDVDLYLEMVESSRRRNPNLSVLTGIEADFIDGHATFLQDFLSAHPFDLVIMSVHFIDHWPRNQWVFDFHFDEHSIRDIYHDYFQAMIRGVDTGLFDVVGHLDLIKQPGFPVMDSNPGDIGDLLDAVARQGMAVELNTSGLRKPISEYYPSWDIVEQILERGIPVTLGSDAHSPDQVGFGFDGLLSRLKNRRGLRWARYKKRRQTIRTV